jgi:hypothetical protein
MPTVREHWNAFWRSGPDNLYTFLWWGIFGTTVASVLWVLSYVLPVTSLFAMFLAKWQDRFIGAFMAYAFMIVCILGRQILKQTAERGREQATSPTIRVTIPVTFDMPRGMSKMRVKWDRVIQWTVIFATMAALAFYGGLVKTSALFICLALFVLLGAWQTYRENKDKPSN